MAERGEYERFGRWRALDARPRHTSMMSSVWRVREEANASGPVYALKIMKRPKAPTSSAYVRFAREADALTHLAGQHPAIMPLVDRGEVTDETGGRRIYLVMPYYATSLDKAAKGLAGNAEYAMTKLIAVAEALEAAHAGNIIHRDVKPQNVLLDGDEQRVVLGDFGICLLDEEERFTHTESGTLGTPHFVAPELLGGGQIEDVGPTVDVYSLGKTLYAVIAGGNEVFPGSRHRDARYDLVRRFGDARLAHIHGALDLLCAEDPTERPQSMREARTLLEQLREAIRENVRYREGLYRSGPTAEWRALRLTDTLERTSTGSTARRDAVREAVEAVLSEVETLARENRTPAGVVAGPGDEFQLAGDFLRAVDEVLGLVLPLGKSEDDGLEDAQAMLLRWLDAERAQTRATAFLRGVASVTLYVLAAVAWRLQRGALLAWCIRQITGRYEALVYMDAFGGFSHHSSRAVEQALRQSAVIDRFAREVRDLPAPPADGDARDAEEADDTPPAALLCVAGLMAIRIIWFYPVGDLTNQLTGGGGPPMRDWPAFQREYLFWVEVLPEQLLHSPRWEREVAQTVLDAADARELRRYWKKNSAVLARLLAAINAGRSRAASGWGREYPSPVWREWVEKA